MFIKVSARAFYEHLRILLYRIIFLKSDLCLKKYFNDLRVVIF
jgi:hypothetical protein